MLPSVLSCWPLLVPACRAIQHQHFRCLQINYWLRMFLKMCGGVRTGKIETRLVLETAISREVETAFLEKVPQECANWVG